MIVIGNIKFFTVYEIAELLRINATTVRTYIKQGKLKAQRIGKPFLISETSLQEFLGEIITTPEGSNTPQQTA